MSDDTAFCFIIDFEKGVGSPRRVFEAASSLISGFELLDAALAATLGSGVDPSLVLEDVEAGSLRVILKNVLNAIDDDALKSGDWKKLAGVYLAQGKQQVLRWLDQPNPTKAALEGLKAGLRKLARDTDVRHLPDYPPIQDGALLPALDHLQRAKSYLDVRDRMIVELGGGERHLLNLAAHSRISYVVAPAEDGTEREAHREVILQVRKPDFIRDTMWTFSQGQSTFSAPMLDQEWLEDFQSRRVVLMPGDALRREARITYVYDGNGVLTQQKLAVLKVLEVVPGAGNGQQGTIF